MQTLSKRTESLQKLTSRRLQILSYCAHYRYLDFKHLLALLGDTNTNDYTTTRALERAGLIRYLPNHQFKRDRLTHSQVFEITRRGKEAIDSRHIEVHPTTWLPEASNKDNLHNLNLCLALASLEIALRDRFIPWAVIAAKAPAKTKPFFEADRKRITPDALFTIEYPDSYACFAVELDLSNHGKREYQEKYKLYEHVIFSHSYRQKLGMQQRLYVLTITTNRLREQTIKSSLPQKTSPFLFKVIEGYGHFFDKPPRPIEDILQDWSRVDHPPLNIGEDLDVLEKEA